MTQPLFHQSTRIKMGNLWSIVEDPPPPPQIVLVPPLFYFPPLAARTRMLESPYNLLFAKLPLRSNSIPEEIFPRQIQVAGPLDRKPEEKNVGNAQFRWQSDVDDPHTFMDIFVSTSAPAVLVRSCAYYPKFGLGAFGIFPVLLNNRVTLIQCEVKSRSI